MRLTGQILSRLSKRFKCALNKTGVVYAVSNVGDDFMVMVQHDDDSYGVYKSLSNLISIGDKVKIVLAFVSEDKRGLRHYLPRAEKYE